MNKTFQAFFENHIAELEEDLTDMAKEWLASSPKDRDYIVKSFKAIGEKYLEIAAKFDVSKPN